MLSSLTCSKKFLPDSLTSSFQLLYTLAVSTEKKDLLDPHYLSRIKDLSLLAKVVVDGSIYGVHRSVRQGRGAEFFQYRPYERGEDLKSIDWKVFAKRDELVSKTFQEDTNFSIVLLLDGSASMGYSGTHSPCSKFRYAQMLAASFAYLAFRQGDKVGLVGGSESNPLFIPVSSGRGHFHRIISALSSSQPEGKDLSAQAWSKIQSSLPRRSLVVYLSDFLENENQLADRLSFAHSSFYECICLQVLDDEECSLPEVDALRFVGMEGQGELSTSPKLIRRKVEEDMQSHQELLKSICLAKSVEFQSLRTSDDLGLALHRFIGLRSRKK